jgi:capsule polysaccharide export protein KpsE/RkpR
MSAAEQRLNSLSDAATRASERRMMLESALRIAKDRQNAIRTMTTQSVAQNEKASDLDRQITELESTIASMKDHYTAEYPDLQSAQERLAVLRRQRDEANKPSATPKATVAENPMNTRERVDAQGQIDSIESQLKATSLEDQSISRELVAASSQLRAFQARVASAPAGEKEYSDLLRDRDIAKQKYLDADAKAQKSKESYDMEQNKQGETLEVLDDPSLPTDPTEPKRYFIIPMGAVGGLVLGILLVAIREVKNTSLKTLKDARVYTQLSILGSIPLLENDVVVQRRKQVTLVSWATATVLGLAIIVGSVAHYYLSKA